MVDLAGVGAVAAARPRAHRERHPGEVALLVVGVALRLVQVQRAFGRVEQRDFRELGLRCQVFGAGDGRAVGEPEDHVVSVAGEDLHVLVQPNNHDRAAYGEGYAPAAAPDEI